MDNIWTPLIKSIAESDSLAIVIMAALVFGVGVPFVRSSLDLLLIYLRAKHDQSVRDSEIDLKIKQQAFDLLVDNIRESKQNLPANTDKEPSHD